MVEKLAKIIYFSIFIAIIYFSLPVVLPFLVALVLAVAFDPVIVWLQKKTKMNRIVASSLTLTSFFVSVFYGLYYIFSVLLKEVISFAKQLPEQAQEIYLKNHHIYELYENLSEANQKYIKDSLLTIGNKATGFLSSFVNDFFNFTVKEFPNYFLISIFFFLATYIFSFQMPFLKDKLFQYIEEGESQKKLEIVLANLKIAFIGFIRAQFLLSFLTFALAVIGLVIIGVKPIILASIIIVIVDLLPVLGTGSALVPWAIYAFVTGNVYQGVGLIVLFLVITIIRRTVEPKLFAHTIGIDALSTVISMFIGFKLLGVLGMILGPSLIIIFKALQESKIINIKIKI